jgi:hypothetical protein
MEDEQQTPKWLKWLPFVALGLSVTILLFQVLVLHQWHVKLSNQMVHVTRKVSSM